jgi:hypothetical protein
VKFANLLRQIYVVKHHLKEKGLFMVSAACRSFGGAFCAGAVLLISFSAEAQNLFVSRDNTLYEFTSGGAYSTFATEPGDAVGLAFNSAGDLFVPDSDNGTITEIAPNGTPSTFASGLETPTVLAFNSAGDLFVSDIGASAIYEFTPDGVRSTFATGLAAIYGLAFNSAGNLFVAANSDIYQFTPNGVRSVFASVPGEGLEGLAFNSAGNLFWRLAAPSATSMNSRLTGCKAPLPPGWMSLLAWRLTTRATCLCRILGAGFTSMSSRRTECEVPSTPVWVLLDWPSKGKPCPCLNHRLWLCWPSVVPFSSSAAQASPAS